MTTEAVRFMFSADDKATAKFKNVGNAVGDLDKQVKGASKTAKDGGEVVGKFAASFGNSQMAGAAGQIAMIADSLGKVAEMGKLAKIGMAGLAVVVGFQVGQEIERWISGTAEWESMLAGITEQMQSQAKLAQQIADRQFDQARGGMSTDPVERRQQELDLLKQIEQSIAQQKNEVRESKQELEAIERTWANTFGYADKAVELGNEHVKIEQDRLRQLQDQARELRAATSERQMQLDLARQAAAEEERRKASANAFLSGLRDQNMQMALTREEYELQKAKAAGLNDQELYVLQAIQQRRAELEAEKQQRDQIAKQQAEAAEASKRQQEAAIKARNDAERQIAATQLEAEKQRQQAAQKLADESARRLEAANKDAPQLQATQSRLLNRGAGNAAGDQARKAAAAAEAQIKTQQLMAQTLPVLQTIAANTRNQLSVIGD